MKSELFLLLSFFLVLGIFFSFPFIENNYTVDENGFKHYVLTSEKNNSTLDIITKSLSRYNRDLTDNFDQMNLFLSLFLLFLLLFLISKSRWFFTFQTSNQIRFHSDIIRLFLRKKNLENQSVTSQIEFIEFLRKNSALKSNTFSSNLLHFQAQISYKIRQFSLFKKNIFVFPFLILLLLFSLTDFAYAAVTFTPNDDADSTMLSTQTGEISFTTGTGNSNAILVVGIAADETTITGVNSVTWGTDVGCTGTPQSFIQQGIPNENSDAHTEIWYLIAPTQSATSRNICVDWGAGDVPGDWAFNVAMFENVDQSTPLSATNTATGTSSPMTGTVNVATGEMGYQVSIVINSGTATANIGDTELLQISTGGSTKQIVFISYDATVATPSTLGSTISKNAAWAMKLITLTASSAALTPISVTDTPTITDSVSSTKTSSISVSDTPTITDSVSSTKTSSISVSDTPTITDSATVVKIHSISISDTPVLSDSATVVKIHSISVSDTPVLSDSATAVSSISISDTPVLSDSATVVKIHSISVSDIPVLSDSTIVVGTLSVSDTPTITDSATVVKIHSISVSDIPTITDSVSSTKTSSISVSDTPTITDSATVVKIHSISLSDTPTITDSATVVKIHSISISDTPVLSDSATVVKIHSISLSDTPVLSDSATVVKIHSISLSDTPTITDSATVVKILSISVSDTPVLSDSATVVKIHSISVSDTPTITDSATTVSSISVSDTPVLSDSATVVKIHSISVSDTPVLSDSATTVSSISISDTPVLSDSATVVKIHSISVSDTPTITDSVSSTKTSSISLSDTPVLSDSATVVKIHSISLSDTPTITDSATVVKIHSISVSDTPVLSDSATTVSSISVSDTPVLSDSATVVKIHSISVSDTPVLSDSATVVKIHSISVSDTPVISDSATTVSSISVSDTPVLSDSATVVKIHSISVSDTPVLSDSATTVSSISVSDTPVLSDSATVVKIHSISVSDTPVLSDSGNIIGALIISVSDTPTISDSSNFVGMLVITVSDTPVLYDSSNLGGTIQIADGTSVSTTTSSDVISIFQYPETEELTTETITLNVALPAGMGGTIVVATTIENNIESGLNLVTAVDITAPCTDTCTIKFTIPNSILTAAGLTSESASIIHDTNGNEILELSEAIATTIDTTSIPGSTIFTATADSTSKFGVGAGSSIEEEENDGGGGCDDCTPPTLGVDSSGKRMVSNGFAYNGNSVDVELYFTPYPLITTLIGVNNTAVFKIYENSGPENIRHFELAFGLDEIQGISQNPSRIEWDRTWDNIESITVIDPENVFENIQIETDVGNCLPDSNDSTCLIITILHSFRAPLDYNIVGTNVWDHKRNAWQNYYNEGIQIEGDSLNPPKQHVGIHKGHMFNIIETSKKTALDEFGNNWILEKGLWSKEYTPNIAPDQKAIELFKLKEKEIAKAVELVLQMCPRCNDIPFDKINNTFAYQFPYQYEHKLDDPEIQRKLQIEADRAYELFFKNYQWFEERDD